LELTDIKLFSSLEPHQFDVVTRVGRYIKLSDGAMLVEAGHENHHLYIVLSGKMEVRLHHDASSPIIYIEPGDLIGEMSIIDGGKTSAYVRSAGASELLSIHEDDFWQHLSPLPGLMRNLTRMVTQRFRLANEEAARSLTQQLYYEHLKRELAAAGTIQMGMLHRRFPLFPHHPEVEVHATLVPAKEVGGDLYDAFALDDEHILIAVGDVSGKGMPAALFMMRTLTLLRSHAHMRTPPEELLGILNGVLCESNETDMFVTMYIAILCTSSGEMRLLNAGHLPPLISRQGGAFQEVTEAKGALLGVMPAARFRSAEITLASGDRMLFYTDGVTEAENPEQEQFSLQRTRMVLDDLDAGIDMQGVVEGLAQAVGDYAGSAAQSDDITILALRFIGRQK
jgi:phosphoserine phosphatase RsbU/P